jgi:hypothetical protein
LAYYGVTKYLAEKEKIARIEKHLAEVLDLDYKMVPHLYGVINLS